MDNIKSNSYFIRKAINDIDVIIEYTKNVKTYDDFMSNNIMVDAIMFRLIQLVENIKNIDSNYKESHREIPWCNIIGFRNGIVHEYGSTDYTIVYEIISKNIYELKELFSKTL